MRYHPTVTCFNQFVRILRRDNKPNFTIAWPIPPYMRKNDVKEHLLKLPGTSACILLSLGSDFECYRITTRLFLAFRRRLTLMSSFWNFQELLLVSCSFPKNTKSGRTRTDFWIEWIIGGLQIEFISAAMQNKPINVAHHYCCCETNLWKL